MPPEEKKDIKKETIFDEPIALSVIVGAFIVAISVIVGAFIIKSPGSSGVPSQGSDKKVIVAARADAPVIGNKNAPVTMYEFGDFQCPFCQSFVKNTLPSIIQKYVDTGKVKIVFRHFPLSFHVNAQISAEAAECASRQGKFEAYHNMLYTKGTGDGTGLDMASLKSYAVQLGLNTTVFNSCVDNHEARDVVASDLAEGKKVGVDGTPSFYINGIQVVGAQPVAVFEQVIDEALK